MGFIKFVIWTWCAMALGIYISTARYENGTPLEQMQRVWKQHGPSQTAVRETAKDALESARGAAKALPSKVGTKPSPQKPADKKAELPLEKPEEHHTPEDRAEVNRLIAQRADTK